jgi:hypothetical protein
VDDANLLILDILSISIHPDYNGVAAYFDVAVIKTKDVTFSEFIRPVCLPRYVVVKYTVWQRFSTWGTRTRLQGGTQNSKSPKNEPFQSLIYIRQGHQWGYAKE